MSSLAVGRQRGGILRHSLWDALLISLAVVQGALLLTAPSLPLIALGLWWNSNTIAHYFLHRPFFRYPVLNASFSLYQSVLLGIPQRLWKDRHLAHHADVPYRLKVNRQLAVETLAVLVLWIVLLVQTPLFFLTVYLPGYLVGLGLCHVHGYYEHRQGTTSHYGFLYNMLFFNDGYHVEHHAHPGEHWTRLPRHTESSTSGSRWPAVLRWLDLFSLETLERWVLRSPWLQRFVLSRHERAFRRLLPELSGVRKVAIIGGGLFPRTLMILKRLLPEAKLVVIDASAENLETARQMVSEEVEFIHAWYDPTTLRDFDLAVFPLAFKGDRVAIYQHPPAPLVVVHDWVWRSRGTSVLVSLCLLKRLNLVRS